MKKYKVRWEKAGTADEIKAENEKSAYSAFIEKAEEIRQESVIVNWGYMGEAKFSDHIEASSTKITSESSKISSSTSTSSIEDKLDKLYDVMNHIRWIGLVSEACLQSLSLFLNAVEAELKFRHENFQRMERISSRR